MLEQLYLYLSRFLGALLLGLLLFSCSGEPRDRKSIETQKENPGYEEFTALFEPWDQDSMHVHPGRFLEGNYLSKEDMDIKGIEIPHHILQLVGIPAKLDVAHYAICRFPIDTLAEYTGYLSVLENGHFRAQNDLHSPEVILWVYSKIMNRVEQEISLAKYIKRPLSDEINNSWIVNIGTDNNVGIYYRSLANYASLSGKKEPQSTNKELMRLFINDKFNTSGTAKAPTENYILRR